MAKTAQIVLDETTYTVRKLNMGELQEVTAAFSKLAPADVGYLVLSIALKRADPSVQDFKSLEPNFDQIQPAAKAILELSGFKFEAENPPAAAAGSTQTSSTPSTAG